MKIFNPITLFLKWTLIVLLVSWGTLIAFLSFDRGKRTLVTLANQNLISSSYLIEIKSLSSFFPLVLSIKHIDLLENKEPWIHLQDLHLELDIGSFILGKTLQGTLSGKELSLIFLPKVDEDVQEEIAGKDPLVQLALIVQDFLETFKKADLKIDLDHFHLSPEIAGQDVDMTLNDLVLRYDSTQDQLFAEIPLSTKSFGSPLNLFLRAQGGLKKFTVSFGLKTPRFDYDTLSLQNITFKGNVAGLPTQGQGFLDLDLTYNGVRGTLKIDSITLAGLVLSLKDISLKGLQSSVHGEAMYNFATNEVSAAIKGSSQNLTALSSLVSLGNTSFSGTTQFEGRVDIKDSNESRAHFKLQGQKIKGREFSIEDLVFDLTASNFFTQPTLKGSIQVTTFKNNYVLFDTLSLESNLEKGNGALTLQGQGKDLTLEMISTIKFEQDVKAITVKKFEALYNKAPFILEKPFTLESTGDTLTLSPATLKIVDFPFTAQGTQQGSVLDFSLKGEVDLSVLSQLFLYTGDIVKGFLFIDFAITGTADQPDYEGIIELKKGYYENITYGTKLYDLSFKAHAKEGLITLKDVKTRDGYGGYLRLNGAYDLGKKFFDFKVDAINMRFAYTDQLKVIAREGHLIFKGPFNNVQATGSLKMGEVSYNVIAAFASNVAQLNVVDPANPQKNFQETTLKKQKKKKSPDDFHVTFDFDVEIPPVVSVYGLGLNSLWEGGLKITQSLEDILLVGEITLKEGEIDFLGQTIEIDEGALTFDGQEDNIPYLALQASLEKENFKAIVALNGRANNPTFALSSEPPLPQEEVLSQLLFGSSSSKLSPLSALKLAKVAVELSGAGGGGSFTDLMKSQMGKEDVSVEGGDDKKEATFQAKDNLSDKVNIHLDQGIKPTDTKVVVDVDITPRISISTEAGASKSSESVGVNYNWDY